MSEKPNRRKLTFSTGVLVGLLLSLPGQLIDRWVLGHYATVEPVLRVAFLIAVTGLVLMNGYGVLSKRRRDGV